MNSINNTIAGLEPVKLKDALFLVHPKAKDDAQQVVFDKIVRDELAIPYTLGN